MDNVEVAPVEVELVGTELVAVAKYKPTPAINTMTTMITTTMALETA